MDKTFQGSLQRFFDLKNCSHFNENEGTKLKKEIGKFFVKKVIDPPSVLISSKQVW